jgi:hypothetical protein
MLRDVLVRFIRPPYLDDALDAPALKAIYPMVCLQIAAGGRMLCYVTFVPQI